MPNLDQIEAKVNALDKDESTPFEFRDVYKDIEDAGKTTKNTEIDRLRDILSDFRGKLPNKVILKPIRVKARDLANELMLSTLAERVDRINTRNETLNNLNAKLDVQIAKGNADAAFLTQIKEAINKATATVNEIKNLIDKLTATDATAISNIDSLINALANISSIFEPDDD